MIAELRKPLFFLAVLAAGLVVLVELASPLLVGGGNVSGALAVAAAERGVELPGDSGVVAPPGRGIGYLALVDAIVLYTVALMGVSLLIPDRLHGKLQGIATVLAALVLLVVAVGLLIAAFVELTIMLALLPATPFGTLAYLAVWGFFPTGDAEVLLGLLMALKVAACVLLVLAHQRFLQNKGLVLLLATSLVCTVLLTFLHGLVPGFLVSITDGIGAIVIAVLAVIWGLVLLVGSIPSVVKAVRSS